jgi:hypothetical protein
MLLIALHNVHLHNTWGVHACQANWAVSLHDSSILLPSAGMHALQHCGAVAHQPRPCQRCRLTGSTAAGPKLDSKLLEFVLGLCIHLREARRTGAQACCLS